jgi:hypothetical protein
MVGIMPTAHTARNVVAGYRLLPSSSYPGSMSEMFGIGGQPFAPMLFWVQAAEMWQRNWMAAMSLWVDALAFPSHQDDRSTERTRSAVRH